MDSPLSGLRPGGGRDREGHARSPVGRALRAFTDSLSQNLADRLDSAARAEFRSLREEGHAELLGRSLISFAARQENAGHEAVAMEIYAALLREQGAETGLAFPESVFRSARLRLEALEGRGDFGARAEVLARRFVHEAAEPSTILAMSVGSAVYATARLGLLARFAAAPANFLTRGFTARALAGGGAFLAEVPAFWASGKGLRELASPGAQAWDLETNARELLGAGLTLGALKLAGFGAHRFQARWGSALGLNGPLASAFLQQGSMLGGIYAGHWLEERAGLRAPLPGATTLLDSLVMLLQFNVGGRLSSRLMGERWAARSRELEMRLQSHPNSMSPGLRGWSEGSTAFGPPLALAVAGGPRRAPVESPEVSRSRPQVLHMEGGESPGGRPVAEGVRAMRQVLEDVVAKGRHHEVQSLKNLLRDALADHAQREYIERQLYRWKGGDIEEWRSGIKRVSEMLESIPVVHSSIEGSEAFRNFAADWISRPHFAKAEEIPMQIGRDVGYREAGQRFLSEFRRSLLDRPSLIGVRQFLQHRQGKENPTIIHESREGEAVTALFFNWKTLGVRVPFSPQGHLHGTILVRPAFERAESPAAFEAQWAETLSLENSAARTEARREGREGRVSRASRSHVPRARAAKPAATVSPYAPQAGENASLWMMRLVEESRSPDREVAHQIVQELNRRLLDRNTEKLARDAIDRLVSLSDSVVGGSTQGLIARRYRVARLSHPVTIVSIPTTFLPESWSEAFVDGIASHRTGTVARALEIGSGTGWASLVMSKLRLAREIVGVDMNSHAPAVGQLNATINEVYNVRFEQGNLLSGLRQDLKADLIVACLPQVRASGEDLGLREAADYYRGGQTYFDGFSLGLIEQALGQSLSRLNAKGSVLFNMGGRPGRAVLEDLFSSQGFRPHVLHARMIPQDPGTSIASLAARESASGLRFEFFRPDNPHEPISAAEAMKTESPHHMLYLMEGRPYGDLLQASFHRRMEEPSRFYYTEHPGQEHPGLRGRLAEQLVEDWGLKIAPETLFLGPSAETLLEGALRVLPTDRGPVVVAGLGESAMPRPLEGYAPRSVTPDFASLNRLGEGPLPSVMVLRMPREAWSDREGMHRFLEQAAERRIHTIFLDDLPMRVANGPHPLLERMALSPAVAEFTHLIQSVDRRFRSATLPLGVMLSANASFHELLSRYGDLTHSRVSSLVQEVYSDFLETSASGRNATTTSGTLDLLHTSFVPSRSIDRALETRSAFEASPRGEHPDPIDMSFGESQWRLPLKIDPALWQTVSRPRDELEAEATRAVVDYLDSSRGLRVRPQEIVLGAGVQPLIVSALRGLRRIHPGALQVAVPKPSYGLFFPTAELVGAKLIELPTRPDRRFLLQGGMTGREAIGPNGGGRSTALLINEPSNPAGQYYNTEGLEALAREVKASQAYLLFDDVFGMLDLGRNRQRRGASMPLLHGALGDRFVGFGGVSKEFASGGLRFGFAVVPNPLLHQAMRDQAWNQPDPFALSVAPALMRNWEPLVREHSIYLGSRAFRLEQAFRARNFSVVDPQGGYSLLANLTPLFNRKIRLRAGGEAVIGPENLHHLLYNEVGIKVHSDEWARVPGHYRFVYSIDRLDEAIARLQRFFRSAR